MKKFWSRYSYDCVKTFLFHLICSIFGLSVIMLLGNQDTTLRMILSIVVILIFMFLLYGEMWKIGSSDACAGVKTRWYTGVLIGVFGSAVDYLIALFWLLFAIPGFPDGLQGAVVTVSFVYEGMFRGLYEIGGVELGSCFWFYVLTSLPAVVTCTLGYFLGSLDRHLTKLFVYENPEEKEVKAEKKKIRQGNTDD